MKLVAETEGPELGRGAVSAQPTVSVPSPLKAAPEELLPSTSARTSNTWLMPVTTAAAISPASLSCITRVVVTLNTTWTSWGEVLVLMQQHGLADRDSQAGPGSLGRRSSGCLVKGG